MWEKPTLEDLIDLGKCCPDENCFTFDQILIRLAGNENSHEILDEFGFGADQTLHMRVTCPLVFHRHIMGKCSDFNSQITRTGLKSRTSPILAHFRLLTCELPALEGPYRLRKIYLCKILKLLIFKKERDITGILCDRVHAWILSWLIDMLTSLFERWCVSSRGLYNTFITGLISALMSLGLGPL